MSESWRKFINTRVSVVNSPFVEQLYHIPCCSGTRMIERSVQVSYHCHLPDVSSPHIYRSISLCVWGLLDKLADRMYCRVMCMVVLIFLRESVGCRSQQQWGICRSTRSSFCAVRAFRMFYQTPRVRTVRLFIRQPLYVITLSGSTGLLIFSILLVICIC